MSFGLLLPFDTDDGEFARGFELGRLWQLLKSGDPVKQEYLRTKNAEMALRMAEATGRQISAEVLNDEWMVVSFQ